MINRTETTASPQQILARQGFVVLDGGLATELESRGHDLDHKLWSARLLDDDPDAITGVHYDYLEAGADCITAATYQASFPGFKACGYSVNRAENLIRQAVALSEAARTRYREAHPDSRPVLVAASIGPYGAWLQDGSEYRGNYSVSATGLRAFHEPRWALLRDTAADFFAIETIPSIEEAEVLRALLDDSPGLQAWVSFSCRDESRISDGTPLAECASLFADCTGVFAIGINCTAPELLVPLIGAVRQGAPDKSVVVYPNSGERYIARGNAWEGQSQCSSMGRLAVEWFESGARFIGGCCRTTPADIARLRNALTGRT